ncbi:MAG: CoA-binding protein [Flavobacteriaceae bacterium]|nr:CoA-binding protein [Flavobacteriaceae bacterium]
MIHDKLINPESIVVIGGSDNLQSPGGRVLKNLTDHHFRGKIFVVNPKQEQVQHRISYADVRELPQVDLAIFAIPARFIPEAVKVLTEEKGTKGFIIFSAGFSEKDAEGAALEKQIAILINRAGGSLLGPNNIGLINNHYAGVFTRPIPKLNEKGVDFISGSGATAVFMIEAAQGTGLTFSSVYTVGNSAQIGVEEVLEYFDAVYEEGKSSKIKMLYLESIKKPDKFLKHCASLIQKGCKIAAIKAGSSDEGSRAASSHTGALAGSDVFVDALFEQAGIIRCYGRNELITVAGILMQKESKGKNIAIITHAGGPAVMLTDVLAKNGLKIPQISGEASERLLETLYDGSSVANPIDFLATGTAAQLATIIDHCEEEFKEIDAMVVIFGSPGLTTVYDAYDVLDEKIRTCKKPIYAVLPSVVNVKDEMAAFVAKGNIFFTDEVLFGTALSKVYRTKKDVTTNTFLPAINPVPIRSIIDRSENGYLSQENALQLLRLAGISVVESIETNNRADLIKLEGTLPYPVVQKVLGPLHKSDVGGVISQY